MGFAVTEYAHARQRHGLSRFRHLEGTQMSEGRGTTRPFELVGAPYIDATLSRRVAPPEIAGRLFSLVRLYANFSKAWREGMRRRADSRD